MLLALIQIIYNLIKKPSFNVMACGIFGQCTNTPRRINQSNVKILGMFNESRGRHSCGITFDSEIYHGLEKDKLFTDFIKGKTFKAEVNPLMFGHTRSASVGAAINEHNAHPFGFGTNAKGGYKFIGVHNGTLYNHLELAEAYDINTKASYKGITGVDLERTKIDSEILLEIIHTTRSYKVLSEYIGKAALVWTDTDAPNVTYFWSGQSRMTEAYITGPEMEERPMNIWIDAKNSFYFSSMPESLEAIGAPTKDVFQIEYNTVYQVINGDFKHAEMTKVSRKQCFQTETYVSKHTNYHTNAYSGKYQGGKESEIDTDACDWTGHNTRFNKIVPGATATLNDTSTTKSANIYNDIQLLNQNDYKNKVYSKQLRYWQKGHIIEGIFCWIPNYGFYKLGDDNAEAMKSFEEAKGLRFYGGEFIKDRTLLLGTIPFPAGPATPVLYYFIEGVMLQDAIDYNVLLTLPIVTRKDYEKLSHVSKHPVINIGYAYKTDSNQCIFKDGKLYTGTAMNLGFEKAYHIVNGNLLKTVTDHNSEITPVVVDSQKQAMMSVMSEDRIPKTEFNPKIMEESMKNIKHIEETIVKDEILDKQAEEQLVEDKESVTDAIITEMIDKEITPCLMSFQNCREELNLLPGQHPRVTVAKALVTDLIQTINQFVN